MEARRAYPASVERVPFVPTGASPAVILAGRPPAERASDSGTGGVEAFLLIGFTINNNSGLVVREGAHAAILCHARLPAPEAIALVVRDRREFT
jgi:hypothetical protein